MMRQRVRVLSTDIIFIRPTIFGLFNNMQLIALNPLALYPWVVVQLALDGVHTEYLYVDPQNSFPPITSGIYQFNFTLGTSSPPNVDALLEIEVVSSFYDYSNNCKTKNEINIVWITREGGRASYKFNQRINYDSRLGESKTYDNSSQLRYFSRGKSFDSKTVFKTGIIDDEIDLISSLRESIQAWEYDEVNDISIPIIIDPESFQKYNTKEKMNEVSFKYRLANYKITQSQ